MNVGDQLETERIPGNVLCWGEILESPGLFSAKSAVNDISFTDSTYSTIGLNQTITIIFFAIDVCRSYNSQTGKKAIAT